MTAGRQRLVLAALLSGLAHVALAPAALLATRSERRERARDEMTIDIDVEPAPEHEAEPPAEVAPVEQRAAALLPPDRKPARRAARSQIQVDTDDATGGDGAVGVSPPFSVSMQSSSAPGEVATGAGPRGAPGSQQAGTGSAAGAPIEGAAASVLPLPVGRCSGTYTEEARQAGVEGTVILDLVVDENGRARDIRVVQGLGHGLTGAAIAALRRCRFTPGERSGSRVAVRLRAFKIRFLLRESD